MKITPALFTISLVAVSVLSAQEPAPAKPQMRSTLPSPVAPPPAPANETLPLIPETPDNNEKAKGGGAISESGKKDKTSAAEDDLTARVRLREIKTQALKDAKIQAEWDRAHAAKTDFEKRDAMKNFYTLLYARMAKLDGSLQKRIDKIRDSAIHRLTQHDIDPTDPLSASERDERDGRGERSER